MIKFWAKILIDDKIVKSYELQVNNYDYHNFEEYLREICYNLDIPNPIILDKHIIDFTVYKNAKFTKADFVEKIDFDKMLLQCI